MSLGFLLHGGKITLKNVGKYYRIIVYLSCFYYSRHVLRKYVLYRKAYIDNFFYIRSFW